MNPALIAAAVRLARVLGDENRALESFDLRGAGALLDAKTAALGAFVAAQALQARSQTPATDHDRTAHADGRALVERLGDLAATNKRLLERAIGVQGRVIGMVARAAARDPAGSTRYRSSGVQSARAAGEAFAISTEA